MDFEINIKEANNTTLVYLFQQGYAWGRGKSIKEAKQACKKANGRIPKGKAFVSTYAVKEGVPADEALKGLMCEYMSQTYSTANAVLLGTTEM
jgi:hypothetical protein